MLGEADVDLRLALEKLGARFGVRTLMLEGGGGINGSFLRDGLIDEVSLLVAPVRTGAPVRRPYSTCPATRSLHGGSRSRVLNNARTACCGCATASRVGDHPAAQAPRWRAANRTGAATVKYSLFRHDGR